MENKSLEVGLCERCVHCRVVKTARGGRFLLCRRSFRESGFPRYPALPVIKCNGFLEIDDA